MTALETPSDTIPSSLETWRGSGEIWTSDTYHLSLFGRTKLTITDGMIGVHLPKKQIHFATGAIVDARTFRLPVPSMTLIFSHGDKHALVSLFRFSRRLQEQFIQETGLTITDHRSWRIGLEAGRDQKRFSLQK